jgi:hydroxymethylbilane synthase
MDVALPRARGRTLRIATRRSALALEQTKIVVDRLRESCDLRCEILPITTKGDAQPERSLIAIGGDGVFVKELMQALLDERADIAVHSLKDLPTDLPPELQAGAVLKRDDPRDALISKDNAYPSIESLPEAAVIGTSSLRRAAVLRHVRNDLRIALLRGNVDSRVRKVLAGECDAAILALAGLKRIGLLAAVGGGSPLSVDVMVPAVGQGALYAQCRAADAECVALLAALDDAPTALATRMERAFLSKMGGGCVAPVGAHVAVDRDSWRLWAIVAAPSGTMAVRRCASGRADDAAEAVAAVEAIASEMLAAGGREIIAETKLRESDAL